MDFFEHGYSELTEEEKTQLKEDAKPFGKDPKFQGFDGNNESEYMSVASFIINDLERFEKFKERGLNSHTPSLDIHNRMLAVFEPIRSNLVMRGLSLRDLTEILNAGIHPENR